MYIGYLWEHQLSLVCGVDGGVANTSSFDRLRRYEAPSNDSHGTRHHRRKSAPHWNEPLERDSRLRALFRAFTAENKRKNPLCDETIEDVGRSQYSNFPILYTIIILFTSSRVRCFVTLRPKCFSDCCVWACERITQFEDWCKTMQKHRYLLVLHVRGREIQFWLAKSMRCISIFLLLLLFMEHFPHCRVVQFALMMQWWWAQYWKWMRFLCVPKIW